MSDLRAYLVDALRKNFVEYFVELSSIPNWPKALNRLVDVLLSLPGIAIVEPITEQCGAPGDTWECPACSADWVAKDAGPLDIRWELLAAANAADQHET
jgi:hypothetical protein